MNNKTTTLLLLFSFSPALFAGIEVNEVFQSGFEGEEDCVSPAGGMHLVQIETVAIDGDFTLNNSPFPGIEYDDATFWLRDRRTGGMSELGNSAEGSYAVHIIPGRYDVIYRHESGEGLAPLNDEALLMEDVHLWTDQTLHINVTSVTLDGEFRLNGVLFPEPDYDDGEIYLHSEQLGTINIGNTHDQLFADVAVIAGDYEIRYQVQSQQGQVVPVNEWGLVGNKSATTDDPNFIVNVLTEVASGAFTHNGAAFPLPDQDDGNFWFESADGDRGFLGSSKDQSFSKPMIVGKYDVFWEVESRGPGVPHNVRARVASNVDFAKTANIDVTSHVVSGSLSLNGNDFPADPLQTADIYFRDKTTGSESLVAHTHEGPYEVRLVTGSYDVIYRWAQGTAVPRNEAALLQSAGLLNQDQTLDIDVPANSLSITALHNGAAFPVSNQQFAEIRVGKNDGFGPFVMGWTYQGNFTASLVAGDYDVYYNWQIGNQVPGNKMARVLQGIEITPPGLIPVIKAVQANVPSMLVSATVELNGAPAPASAMNHGFVNLHRNNEDILWGDTALLPLTRRIINRDGYRNFDVRYDAIAEVSSMPINQQAKVGCVRFNPPVF